MDNYAAHKHPAVRDWLTAHPRVTVHFTPTHASWMNLIEVWFSIIERQAIHRGTFTSVKDLNANLTCDTVGGLEYGWLADLRFLSSRDKICALSRGRRVARCRTCGQ